MPFRLYRIIRWMLTALAAAVLIPIVGQFAIAVAEEHGLYKHPTARVEAALSLLISLQNHGRFWPAISGLTGLVIGMWLDSLGRHSLKRNIAGVPKHGSRRTISAQKPDLRLALMGGNIFVPDAKDVRDHLTGIALNVKVWNIGAPSVATEWSLFVVAQNAEPILAQFTEIPESLRVGGPINSVVIRSSDCLETKTRATPIQRVPVEGTLLFYAPIKQKVVLARSTRLELMVKDIYETEFKVTKKVGDWLHG